jgi:hypothetical protein
VTDSQLVLGWNLITITSTPLEAAEVRLKQQRKEDPPDEGTKMNLIHPNV